MSHLELEFLGFLLTGLFKMQNFEQVTKMPLSSPTWPSCGAVCELHKPCQALKIVDDKGNGELI